MTLSRGVVADVCSTGMRQMSSHAIPEGSPQVLCRAALNTLHAQARWRGRACT
jgi:hypothetical protein